MTKKSRKDKKPAIIVDIDGTISNADHRHHYLHETPKNWDKFNEECANDASHFWCTELVDIMWEASYDIIFVTGRYEDRREVTQDWLDTECGLHDYKLFMRPNGDKSHDGELKVEIYNRHIEPHYDILFCLEDRKRVVDSYRSIGLRVLHCADGDF